MIGKIYKTQFPELTFSEIEKGIWRVFSQWEGETKRSAVGPIFRSKIELLCSLPAYAKECGL